MSLHWSYTVHQYLYASIYSRRHYHKCGEILGLHETSRSSKYTCQMIILLMIMTETYCTDRLGSCGLSCPSCPSGFWQALLIADHHSCLIKTGASAHTTAPTSQMSVSSMRTTRPCGHLTVSSSAQKTDPFSMMRTSSRFLTLVRLLPRVRVSRFPNTQCFNKYLNSLLRKLWWFFFYFAFSATRSASWFEMDTVESQFDWLLLWHYAELEASPVCGRGDRMDDAAVRGPIP